MSPVSSSSFPAIHKVDNVDIFVLLKSEKKLQVVISHINCISKHPDKCKFAEKNLLLFALMIFSYDTFLCLLCNIVRQDNYRSHSNESILDHI